MLIDVNDVLIKNIKNNDKINTNFILNSNINNIDFSKKYENGDNILHMLSKHDLLDVKNDDVMSKINNDNINLQDLDGNTILHYAVKNENYKLSEYLEKNYNVNMNLKNKNNESILPVEDEEEYYKILNVVRNGCTQSLIELRKMIVELIENCGENL